ncbi:hypothetical protein [Mycoplana rhizolycopersici]|uniref:Response regulator n=1 Tax=Mycoplana rhizolycopersici TaxID=2746702 RepID=A0ABX2QIB0_9HYPH|nr:hypothetical protein [Rhizobium rhizolycopersici]NVP56644.1 hypothetical protein [Rhizobium rhizolycopersici]
MNKAYPHIAIVEEEFLIAVDAEFLINSTFECRVSNIRPNQFERWTDSDLAALSLCLVDLSVRSMSGADGTLRLKRLGVPLIFTSVSEAHRSGVAPFDGAPVIMKPYADEVLLAAVGRMLPQLKPRQN